MGRKTTKNNTKDVARHQFEYVPSSVLNYLIGSTKNAISVDKCETDKFKQVGYIMVGPVRKFSFTDTARLAYPELTSYEIARLRVEINSLMIQERKKNEAEKSRSGDK